MANFQPGPPNGAIKCGGRKNLCDFRPISRFISEMIQDRATVIMECQQELICDLSNGAIFNDLE